MRSQLDVDVDGAMFEMYTVGVVYLITLTAEETQLRLKYFNFLFHYLVILAVIPHSEEQMPLKILL